MFPIKTGLGSGVCDQDFYKALTASAMHEIGEQAILDTTILLQHQILAQVYYRREEGLPIPENVERTYDVFSPQEEAELRKQIIDIVMRFHILNKDGLGNRLTPLISVLHTREPIPEQYRGDPFLNKVVNNYSRYKGDLIQHILNFEDIENMTLEQNKQLILESYGDPNEPLDVAIYEDGSVECACKYCRKFFEENSCESLNPLQQIMAQNYEYI